MKKSVPVSIICANYNNEKFLDEFIKSVIDSDVWPQELVIVDDGSKDKSVEKLTSWKDKCNFLILIVFEENRGFGNALNEAKRIAQGKYLMRIDPDDILLPQKINLQYEYLLNNPDVDIVGTNATFFSNSTNKDLFNTNMPKDYHTIIKRYENGDQGLVHGTIMCKKEVYDKFDYIQETVPAEDYCIFARMSIKNVKIENILEPLIRVRVHTNSSSNFLPLSTILKTYQLRDKYYNTNTSKIMIYSNYLHLRFYRNFLFEQNLLLKYMNIILSSFFRLDKVFKKIFRIKSNEVP